MIKDYEKLTGFSSKPDSVFVSESGDDKNNGKTAQTPVKTIERAYEIALAGKKHAYVFVSGNVSQGNIDPEKYKELHISFVGFGNEVAGIDELMVVCNTALSSVAVSCAKLLYGSFTLLTGDVSKVCACSSSAYIYMYGGNIGKLSVSEQCKNVSLFYYCGDIRSIESSENTKIENAQLVKPYERRIVSGFEHLAASEKKIIVNLPRMKAPDGTEFGVYPTEKIGVYDTYSGAAHQFGWGKISYLCYAQLDDVTYYSDSRTDYTLTIKTSGVYNLEICGEHDWIIRQDAPIRGFNTREYLTLPLDAECWEDDNKGTINAKKYEEYSFDGKTYCAKKDHVANLCNVKLPEYTDRYFVGWSKNVTGDEFFDTATPKLSSGEKAYAVFTDEKELAVCGASVDFSEGTTFRFVVSADADLLKNFNEVSMGTLLIPTLDLNSMEEPGPASRYMPWEKIDGNVLDFDTQKDFTDIPAQDVDVVNGKAIYSIELSELSLSEAYIDYTVRAYIKYTDKNGQARVIYSDEYTNNVYYAATQMLKEKEAFSLSDQQVSQFEKAISEIAAFATAPKNGRTLPFRSNEEIPYDDLALDIPYEDITEHQFRQGKNFYETNAGPVVREIHIEHPRADVRTSVFGVVADAHINIVDRTGKDKYDPEVMLSFWTRPGFSQKWVKDAFLNATKLMNTYELFILNGDTVDYTTYGTLDYVKEKVLDKYDNCIFSMGNHEPVKNLQTAVPDFDAERNHRQLYEYFDKDFLWFHTTILADSVMLVTINNGSYVCYTQEQIGKLREAIDTARKNGYIILMFQHVMISTGNPADTHVKSISQGFGDSCSHPNGRNYYNFADAPVKGSKYDFQINMHVPNDDVNDEMYDIITQNTDVIRGLFVAHNHRADYMEILPRNEHREIITDGSKPTLPVHNIDSNPYGGDAGNVMKVVVSSRK